MATQPAFLASGTTSRLKDNRWTVLAKVLGAVQNATSGASAANNPTIRDTRYTLRKKIVRAKAGL